MCEALSILSQALPCSYQSMSNSFLVVCLIAEGKTERNRSHLVVVSIYMYIINTLWMTASSTSFRVSGFIIVVVVFVSLCVVLINKNLFMYNSASNKGVLRVGLIIIADCVFLYMYICLDFDWVNGLLWGLIISWEEGFYTFYFCTRCIQARANGNH